MMCFFTVWAGYFFEMKPLLKNTPDPSKKAAIYERVGGKGLLWFAEKAPVPLSTFSSALVSMGYTRAKGTNAFLMGEWSRTGWWYYYLVAFLIKNTLPFILLSLISFICIRRLGLDRSSILVLTVPVIFFFVVTLNDKAQAGIRYFLPIYPFLFVSAGGAVSYFWRKSKALKFAVAALLSWHLMEAIYIFPDHLAYFNELIGGPKNGYKFLRDSNLDWGQDLKPLGEWVRKERYPEVALFFYGPADPLYYRIPYRALTEEEFREPKAAIYAIGAHHIDAVRWAQEVRPTKVIGYSIFVYDMRKKAEK